MSKQSVFSFFAITVLLLLGAEYARACSCTGGANPCGAFRSEKGVIFSGTVTEVTESNEKYGQPIKGKVRKIKIRVDEIFKGALPTEIVTSDDGYNCDNFPFRSGNSYLIYANGVLENTDNIVKIHLCGGTRSIESAEDDLRFLRQLRDGRTVSTIYGRVERFVNQNGSPNEPLKNTKVTLIKKQAIENGQYKKPKKRDLETVVYTDESGEYAFHNIQTGMYNIRVDLPDGLWIRPQRDFGSGGAPLCDNLSLLALTDGRISGRVLDADGTPAVNLKLNLIPQNKEGKPFQANAQTDKDGMYSFLGVPEGQYKVSSHLGTYSLDDSRSYPFEGNAYPWSQYYLGDTFDLNQAQVVTLTHAGRLATDDQKMPPVPVKRIINGSVTVADGTIPNGIYVTYSIKGMESSMRRFAQVKADGSFSFLTYQEFEYDVYASFHHEKLKQTFASQPFTINAETPGEPIKLIIDN